VQKNPTPVAGRNFVGAQVDASIDPYRQVNLLSTRVVDGGRSLNVWLLSAPKGCGGRFDVTTGKVPIDAHGRFHAQLPFGAPPANSRGSATLRGHQHHRRLRHGRPPLGRRARPRQVTARARQRSGRT
jgi:hypothetical protein